MFVFCFVLYFLFCFDFVSIVLFKVCSTNDTDGYRAFYEAAQWVTGLIVYPVLCATGITGTCNTLIFIFSIGNSQRFICDGKLELDVQLRLRSIAMLTWKDYVFSTNRKPRKATLHWNVAWANSFKNMCNSKEWDSWYTRLTTLNIQYSTTTF